MVAGKMIRIVSLNREGDVRGYFMVDDGADVREIHHGGTVEKSTRVMFDPRHSMGRRDARASAV